MSLRSIKFGFMTMMYLTKWQKTHLTFCPSLIPIPSNDFNLILQHHFIKLWSTHWKNLPVDFTSRFKTIDPDVIQKT